MMPVSGSRTETDIICQFLDPETDIIYQFLDPETDPKKQYLDPDNFCPETDIVHQLLDPETDVMDQFLRDQKLSYSFCFFGNFPSSFIFGLLVLFLILYPSLK